MSIKTDKKVVVRCYRVTLLFITLSFFNILVIRYCHSLTEGIFVGKLVGGKLEGEKVGADRGDFDGFLETPTKRKG